MNQASTRPYSWIYLSSWGRSMYQGPGNIKSSTVNCMDPHDGTAGHRIRQPTSNQLTAYSSSLAQLWGSVAENPSFSPHVSTTRDRGVLQILQSFPPSNRDKNCPIQCSYHLCFPFPSASVPRFAEPLEWAAVELHKPRRWRWMLLVWQSDKLQLVQAY